MGKIHILIILTKIFFSELQIHIMRRPLLILEIARSRKEMWKRPKNCIKWPQKMMHLAWKPCTMLAFVIKSWDYMKRPQKIFSNYIAQYEIIRKLCIKLPVCMKQWVMWTKLQNGMTIICLHYFVSCLFTLFVYYFKVHAIVEFDSY